MSVADLHALNRQALDPQRRVAVVACAGSGKTWLLVSRIVRLLLAGVPPGEILAITFTRKAAQEMAARLRTWLAALASEDEAYVRDFLRERELGAAEIETQRQTARGLFESYLTAEPSIVITTFHSWFLQLLRSAPLDGAVLGNWSLTEQTSPLLDEAWDLFGDACQRDPDTPAARGVELLFREYGLANTRKLLNAFVRQRADWWAYGGRQAGAVDAVLRAQADGLAVPADADLVAALFSDPDTVAQVREYAGLLARNTATDKDHAAAIVAPLDGDDTEAMFTALRAAVLIDKGEPRKRGASAAQMKRLGADGQARLIVLHDELCTRVLTIIAQRAEQASYRANAAGLAAGAEWLACYQRVKHERQVLDFADVEWLAYELICRSEHAATMQFKLDSRYRHVLLDEFQDTNPLQWLVLRGWFDTAAQAGMAPNLFIVGDPKQSIYRFRRAEPRLFEAACQWMSAQGSAVVLTQDESRRCAPRVLDVVNELFAHEPAFAPFERHHAHHQRLPGRVEVLPLAVNADEARAAPMSSEPALRDPLRAALPVPEDKRRELEAHLLVEGIRTMVGVWQVFDDSRDQAPRAAGYGDIMILVRRRMHLETYERALRHAGIPYLTSRLGGLLDTLEVRDLVGLLEFLTAPFDDLKLAQTLRSPVFGCDDADLQIVAGASGADWWSRLQAAAEHANNPRLSRACRLLARWLARADALPVHDQLDRILFEADILARYDAAVPPAMRGAVRANLEAFVQRALDTDAGRYPSLPRFIDELRVLRAAPAEEAPDEGSIGERGHAVRILTVHGAKGLESPIVWLLDAASPRRTEPGYEVLVDWPPEQERPRHFSLTARVSERTAAQRRIAQDDEALAEREDLNLLYVAMTRARQALLVSGCETRGAAKSWYARIRAALARAAALDDTDPARSLAYGDDLAVSGSTVASRTRGQGEAIRAVPALPEPIARALAAPLAVGIRRELESNAGQEYGLVFHRVMEALGEQPALDPARLRRQVGAPDAVFESAWRQAVRLLAEPELRRFFDASMYLRALNELPLVCADGSLRRLDRVVEFAREVWVLDYKTGSSATVTGTDLERVYRAQVTEYCAALRRVFPSKAIGGMLLFTDGSRMLVESGAEPHGR